MELALDMGAAMMESGVPPQDINTFVADHLGAIAGLEIIEPGDWDRSSAYDCSQYAFGVRGGETWAQPGTRIDPMIWYRSQQVLPRLGYDNTGEPAPGNIVAYGPQVATERLTHFGVLDIPGDADTGRVISKFEAGPIIRHPLGLIPVAYGNQATFYAKRSAA